MEVPREDEPAYDPRDHSHLYLVNGKPWDLYRDGVSNVQASGQHKGTLGHTQYYRCMYLICIVMFVILIFWQSVFEYTTYFITDGILVCQHIWWLKWPGSFKVPFTDLPMLDNLWEILARDISTSDIDHCQRGLRGVGHFLVELLNRDQRQPPPQAWWSYCRHLFFEHRN
jgi:hypothetical protein